MQLLILKIQNSIFYKDRWCSTSKLDRKERLTKLMIEFLFWSAAPVSFVYAFAVAWIFPCRPSHVLAYWLVEECKAVYNTQMLHYSNGLVEFLKKCIYTIVNYFMVSYSLTSVLFVTSVLIISPISFRAFLKIYNDNYSMSTKTRMAEVRIAHIYRKMQILIRFYNTIHQMDIQIFVMIAVITCQVLAFSTIILSKLTISNFLIMTIFVLLAVDTSLGSLCMFGVMGDVYVDSVKILQRVKALRCSKWLHKFHRSCAPVKIMFGGSNFIDKFTPLTIENFAFEQIASLILLLQ